MPQQAKLKKPPIRHCVGCGEGKPKKELVRLACCKEGNVVLDETGKAPGRGAYLCRKVACLTKARKKRSLERAFSRPIPEDVYSRLEKELEGADE